MTTRLERPDFSSPERSPNFTTKLVVYALFGLVFLGTIVTYATADRRVEPYRVASVGGDASPGRVNLNVTAQREYLFFLELYPLHGNGTNLTADVHVTVGLTGQPPAVELPVANFTPVEYSQGEGVYYRTNLTYAPPASGVLALEFVTRNQTAWAVVAYEDPPEFLFYYGSWTFFVVLNTFGLLTILVFAILPASQSVSLHPNRALPAFFQERDPLPRLLQDFQAASDQAGTGGDLLREGRKVTPVVFACRAMAIAAWTLFLTAFIQQFLPPREQFAGNLALFAFLRGLMLVSIVLWALFRVYRYVVEKNAREFLEGQRRDVLGRLNRGKRTGRGRKVRRRFFRAARRLTEHTRARRKKYFLGALFAYGGGLLLVTTLFPVIFPHGLTPAYLMTWGPACALFFAGKRLAEFERGVLPFVDPRG